MGYKYLDNSIEFKDVKDIGTAFGSSVLSIKNNYNYNDDETQITSINKKVLNAIDIDWNGAQLRYVSLPTVLDNGNTINTTGQLLALIDDLQEQINAIVYIMNGGGSATTTPDPTNIFPTDISTEIPSVKIYTDGSISSNKANNIKLYDNAQQYRNDYFSEAGGSFVLVHIDKLIVDDETIDPYDGKFPYGIKIEDSSVKLIKINTGAVNVEHLNLLSDGSVIVTTPLSTIQPPL